MCPNTAQDNLQPVLLDFETASAVAERFKILADPTRVRLLSALTEREMCVSELTQVLEMEQSAVSHQLRTLRICDLVQHRKVGRQVYYRLNDHYIQELLSNSLSQVPNLGV